MEYMVLFYIMLLIGSNEQEFLDYCIHDEKVGPPIDLLLEGLEVWWETCLHCDGQI